MHIGRRSLGRESHQRELPPTPKSGAWGTCAGQAEVGLPFSSSRLTKFMVMLIVVPKVKE
jgi:hypothetical protein